jgi:hypothetical protein
MRLRNARRGWALGTAVAAVGALVICAPAGAAYLHPQNDPNGYYLWTNAVYDAGSEANHVTLSGSGRRVYVVRDPNVPISTPAFRPPYVSTDPRDWNAVPDWMPVYASFNCVAPTGKGQGACLATPGTNACNEGGCYFHPKVQFGAMFLLLHGGNDSATLSPGSGTTYVYLGDGNDSADTRNNAVDWIDCGAGLDSVIASPADNVAASCESVTRG